ncbi:myosin heavy chain, non-muscle-like isoform X6 [Mya arenaria]|uniref:myosin heavy chain, non-muscle-like isoform X6 n=1 Tax=Mya arenaria TaxID=6604 RepID=UPI0022E05C21|nr:myosin heavy chain, non-muscle-like isoform X6 [Mya arenaria]
MASSVTPTRLLESPSVLSAEIDQRLEEDGLNPECPSEEKLYYIWRLYQTAENGLVESTEKQEQLKRSQQEEMQEVENYVEHIRHLSDEREALIQELETENDQLKQEIERFRQEQNASTLRDETAEMLIQQGLEEIAQAPTSEQIAFLLVERARLLDELEAEQGRSASALSDGRVSEDLQRTLDKEKEEFLAEYEQQRESTKVELDTLRREHEEEINVVMDENQRLEEELETSKKQIEDLQTKLKEMEVDRKKERESFEKEKEGFVSPATSEETEPLSPLMNSLVSPRYPKASPRQRPASPARSPNDVALRQIISEKTKLEGEILGYKSKIKGHDAEIVALKDKLSKMEKDNEDNQMKLSQLQVKNKSLKAELEETEQQLDETESQVDDLKKENTTLQNTLDSITTEFTSLKSEGAKTMELNATVDKLSDENKQLTTQIESIKQEMDKLISEKDELANQKFELSKSEIKLTNELQDLKSELHTLRTAKDEIAGQKNELLETKTLLDSKTMDYEKLFVDSENMDKENKELLNRLQALECELESTKKESQGIAKQELISTHMKDQNSKLTKEVEDLTDKLYAKNEELEELDEKHEKEVEDLKAKFQLTLNELSKAKAMVEQEREENSELTKRMIEVEQEVEAKSSSLSALQAKVMELERMVEEKEEVEDELAESKKRNDKLMNQIDELEAAKIELEDSRDMVDQEKKSRSQMERRFQDLEQEMDDQRMEHENIQQSLHSKIKSLEKRVQDLQEDLFAAQDELQAANEQSEKKSSQPGIKVGDRVKALEESKAAKVELEERLVAEQHKSTEAVAKIQETSSANQRIENQKSENLEKQIEAMKSQLSDANYKQESISKDRDLLQREVKLLRESTKQFGIKSEDAETMKQEVDQLRRELEHLRTSAQYDEEDRQKHVDKIRTLENFTSQLELDNRELANKLNEMVVKLETADEQLKREKKETMDRQQKGSWQLTQVESDLATANKRVHELREELQKKNNTVLKLESEKVGQGAKSESNIARLEAELNELKTYHRKEVDKLTNKADTANKEMKELRNTLREKDQEILSKQHELKRVKGQLERLEAQLGTESKIRSDLENRNTSLDQEISKVWGQVRTLMEKNAGLETTKRNLEEEMERKSNTVRQAETSYVQSKASHDTTMKALQSRADAAERRSLRVKPFLNKADNLQRELQETSVKLQNLQSQVYQAENSNLDLQDKADRMSQLKNQLDGEKLQRNLLDQTVTELQQQVSMMRQRESKVLEQNRELQHTILDMENKLDEVQDRNQTAFEMDNTHSTWSSQNQLTNSLSELKASQQQHMTEMGKRSMMEQILKLQSDIKDLQYELLTVNERREILDRKYEERKVRTKSKLMKASDGNTFENPHQLGIFHRHGEFYTKEKHRVSEQLNRMDEDLRLTRATLRKELDWKDKMDGNYKSLQSEKRELLSQLNEMEEDVREKNRTVSILQVRTKFLEEENSRYQDRIDSIMQQKHGLDKLLKEHKLGKERENHRPVSPTDNPISVTLATSSGLGNSITSSWDHENLVDTIMNYHPHSPEQSNQFTNQRLGYFGSYKTTPLLGSMGESIDLYRRKDDNASDSDFDADEFDA